MGMALSNQFYSSWNARIVLYNYPDTSSSLDLFYQPCPNRIICKEFSHFFLFFKIESLHNRSQDVPFFCIFRILKFFLYHTPKLWPIYVFYVISFSTSITKNWWLTHIAMMIFKAIKALNLIFFLKTCGRNVTLLTTSKAFSNFSVWFIF